MSNAAAERPALLILAGGAGSRLGGFDKSNLLRNGRTHMAHWQAYAAEHELPCYTSRRGHDDPAAIQDEPHRGPGPVAGLCAAASRITEPWFLSVPVDTVQLPAGLLPRFAALAGAELDVIRIRDAEGEQPLIAFWRTSTLRARCALLLDGQSVSVQSLQVHRFASLDCTETVCGNVNTPADLARFNTIKP